jgi:serine/threonine protein kinase
LDGPENGEHTRPVQGRRIIANRFELVSLVGSGARGAVHRGVDLRSGHAVAVKLLTRGGHDHPENFVREASVLSELTHPNIAKHLAHGSTDEGEPYLVMEWLEGEDLSQRLAREGLSIEETIALARCTAEALALAHARGIAHLDLKPSNLFLVKGHADAVKLLDFSVRGGGGEPLTKTGMLVGTPGYLAPEQIRGRRGADVRADVFALGCILFRCLTGESPFPGEDAMGILIRTLIDEERQVRSLRPEVSVELDALVHEMLSKVPERRPQDATAVIAPVTTRSTSSADKRATCVRPRRAFTGAIATCRHCTRSWRRGNGS